VCVCSDSFKDALDDTVQWLKDGGDVAVSCCLLLYLCFCLGMYTMVDNEVM